MGSTFIRAVNLGLYFFPKKCASTYTWFGVSSIYSKCPFWCF